MKALILAAGFGKRLRPYTETVPKSLFPIAGRPNLDIVISRLIRSGCTGIVINTHHLHAEIERFLFSRKYSIDVSTRHEPEILGTGGAIKNLARHWGTDPFFVVNGDVVADIDYAALYRFHQGHSHPATLVMCHDPEFNAVAVDRDGFIVSFPPGNSTSGKAHLRILTFTGIQVVDPLLLDFIPENRFYSSIDAYKTMMSAGLKLAAYTPADLYWRDIGSPERYRAAVFDKMAPKAFCKAFSEPLHHGISRQRLKGDGSDRAWYRLKAGKRTLIMGDHGIRPPEKTCAATEVDAFTAIGRHLAEKQVPVPRIILSDPFSGLVFLQDLGDTSLYDVVRSRSNKKEALSIYQRVIDLVAAMSEAGAAGFNPAWAYQTPFYDRPMIMEKECRYFVEAFLQSYAGLQAPFEDIEDEMSLLADAALEHARYGFMHRDMQSKNIMIHDGRPYFIDFQGGRMGPFQYDLASLLNDPYTALPRSLRSELLDYAFGVFSRIVPVSRKNFHACFNGCAVTRSLQVLGAFGHLTRRRKKPWFEQYIPDAVRLLKENLAALNIDLPKLGALVDNMRG